MFSPEYVLCARKHIPLFMYLLTRGNLPKLVWTTLFLCSFLNGLMAVGHLVKDNRLLLDEFSNAQSGPNYVVTSIVGDDVALMTGDSTKTSSNNGPVLDLSLGDEIIDNSGFDHHGAAPNPLKTINGPHGPAIVIGDNATDVVFVKGEAIDGLRDFTISFYVKLNGLKYHNNIISGANNGNANELIVAYNDIDEINNGLLMTFKYQLFKFPGTEGVLSDLDWHELIIINSDGLATAIVDGKVMGSSIHISNGDLVIDPGGFVLGQDQDTVGGGFQHDQNLNGAIGGLKIFPYAKDVEEIAPLAFSACPKQGTPCDDGNTKTLHDREDGQCNCIGTAEKIAEELSSSQKVSEQRAVKNKILISGLISLFLFGLVLIYWMNRRGKLEKTKLEKRNQLETEKRTLIEEELALKQKELTAKILHLASKNRTLSNIESKIRQLQSTSDADINVSTKHISRMIAMDTADNEMWEQFSKEFMVLHSDFMEQLVEAFEPFTKTEVRLISLMKMNLSSKEIMSILHISDTGLKKARYRLRKKLKLESNINLQSFLLTFKAGSSS